MSTPHVRIMLSHNYCHFEVELPIPEGQDSLPEVNELRKKCQRLVDEAVRQYKEKQRADEERESAEYDGRVLRDRILRLAMYPDYDPKDTAATILALGAELKQHEDALRKPAYDYDGEEMPF